MKNQLARIFLLFVIMTASAWAQSYPVTDGFTGSGALSSNWTAAAGGVFVPAAQVSDTAVPSVSGQQSMEAYTGTTFTNDQYAQVKFVAHSSAGGSTGPCVRMSIYGDGACYLGDEGLVYLLGGGVGIESVVTGCPIPASGDIIRVSAVGATWTCTDVTTGVSASGTNGAYPTGSPGILVDQRNSTVYAVAQFQADCIPSCSVATPTFSPATGSYSSAQTVTISTTTPSATIYYTTNGTTPTTGSTVYSGPITVSASEMLKAIATATGYTPSAVGTATYTIYTSGYPVTDGFTGSGALSSNWTGAAGGVFVPAAQVSDTAVPSVSGQQSMAAYTGTTFTNDQYAQVKFVAHSSAGSSTGPCVRMSIYGDGACYLGDEGLVYLLGGGVGIESVVTGCPIPASGDIIQVSAVGATWTCTDVTTGVSASGTNGAYPTGSPGILVDQRNSTVYAVAQFQADCIPSCGGTSTPAATPTFSPATGSYSSTQTVTISTTTPSATIYFTTNGTTPTTGSTVYTGPITVAASETVQAIATATGYTPSAVGTAIYTIGTSSAATPTFSPAGGTYSSAQTVTISTTTPSATIYYTTNGTTPTTSSTVYSAPITVSASEMIRAIAAASGYSNSAVGSAAYTISSFQQPLTFSISPYGAGMQPGQTLQLTPACTYAANAPDNCAAAGPVTWNVQSNRCSVSSSGLVSWLIDPLGDNQGTGSDFQKQCEIIAYVGGLKDHAKILGQNSGWTWTILMVPWIRQYDDETGSTPSSVTLVQDAYLTVGAGYTTSGSGAGSGSNPIPVCNWLSSNNTVATVNRSGFVHGISPGSTTISCNPVGTVNIDSGSHETLAVTVVAPTPTLTTWYVDPLGGLPYVGSSTPGGQCDGKHNASYTSVVPGGVINVWRPGQTLANGYQIADAGYSGGGSSPQAGYYETVITPGTTATTGQPNFGSVAPGGTISDGSVTWQKSASPYPTNQACALGNFEYLYYDQVNEHHWGWMIGSGDTVMVAPNSSGYDTATINAAAFLPISCEDWGSNACWMPTVPSGTATHHTQILGTNYASCHDDANKTLLLTYGNRAVNLVDSQFVDVSCFEFRNNTSAFNANNVVFVSEATSFVTLNDILMHGQATGVFGSTGPTGPAGSGISGVTMNYVNISAMANSGINMDDAPYGGLGSIAMAGGITFNNSIIQWTGCNEASVGTGMQPILAESCNDAGGGGGRDGLGTGNTTGNWFFDHSIFRYNSEDGLDLLHSGLQGLTVTNSQAYGNIGQQIKLGPADAVVMQNNLTLNNCNRMLEPFSGVTLANSSLGPCRAATIGLTLEFDAFGSYTLQGNDIISIGGSAVEAVCTYGSENCSDAITPFQNNALLGYQSTTAAYGSGAQTSFLFAGTGLPANIFTSYNNNLFWNISSVLSGGTGNITTHDPLFVNEPPLSPAFTATQEGNGYLDNFNYFPASGSPLIGAGAAGETLSPDAAGVTRPNPPSIGSLEYSAPH